MRILIVHDYGVPVGGAENLSIALREGLRSRGHEARLFASSARPLALESAADATGFGTTGPARRVLQAWNPFAARALSAELARFRPDVVHVRMFMTQLSPAILPLLRGVPALLHVVNYDLICPLNTRVLPDGRPCRETPGRVCGTRGCLPPLGRARAALQRRLWRRDRDVFARTLCNSHRVAEQLVAHGVRCDGVIWNGVPRRAARPPLAVNAAPHAAFAGRLVPKKGVAWLLRAFAKVLREVPEARLSIAGEGPERAALGALAGELGIAARVRWLGHLSRERLEAAFADVWVQAVPSLWEEPFGLVAAEAMMRGTAVIASRGGGLDEQVIDGETGFTVAAGDADALAEGLARVLGERALAERMGAAGRARALEHFTEERVVERFVVEYRRLLAADANGAAPVPA